MFASLAHQAVVALLLIVLIAAIAVGAYSINVATAIDRGFAVRYAAAVALFFVGAVLAIAAMQLDRRLGDEPVRPAPPSIVQGQ